MSNNYLRNHSHKRKTKRITISIEGQIEQKIETMSEMVSQYTGEDWSMSKIVNMLLLGGILAPQKMNTHDWNNIKRFAEGKTLDLESVSIEEYVSNLAALRQIV